MKRITLFCIIICSCLTIYSQATDIVVDCQNPGWLSSMISYGDQQTVRNLKVTGYVNATDLKFIGTLISSRCLDGRLDLSNCNIVKDISEGDDNYLGSYLVPSESKSLRVLLIPKTVKKVEGCTGKYLYVDSVFFDCQMTTISQNCFGGKYTKLGHLEIGENIVEIPKQAFCRIPGTNSEVKLRSVHFPSSITSIGDDAFSMSELEMCNFNDLVNLTNLGRTIYNAAYNYRDYRTFGSCCLDSIIVPTKLEEYPLTAFFLNSGSHVFIEGNTKTLTGGESTRYTYKQSGEGITFHINQLTPPNITNWFQYSNWFEGATVYVPKGAKSAYESSGWSGTNIIEINMYPLIISSSGNGGATYSSTTIKNQIKSFTVEEGTSATISFAPDNGYRIASVKVNDTDVTASVTNNQYTISNISANTTVEVTFEAIPPTTYTLSISATGNGSATYSSTAIKNQTKSFTVEEGSSATISFTSDNGYRIASVKVNNSDVTSSLTNNQYTISNISANTTVEVTFEAIPPTTYILSITATGNGCVNATYGNPMQMISVRGETSIISVTDIYFNLKFSPDVGYRVKSLKINDSDVTSYMMDKNTYYPLTIKGDTYVEVEFEVIPTYSLSIKATGNGSVTYNNTAIKNKTQEFAVTEGTSVTISFAPDNGYRIKSVKVNDTDVTASVTNNRYTISNISANTTVEVTFEAITHTLSIKATGNGSASYNGTSIRGKTSTFTINEGLSATISFSPDNGYRIKSVKVNNTDVTSKVSNNSYAISNISSDTSMEVEFEAIPPTTYSLSIKATGNGTATYDGTSVRGKTSSFTVTKGTSATIAFAPDNGYRIKSVKVNNTDATTKVTNNTYTISNISSDTSVEVVFEANPTYTLAITSTGNGSASYNGTTIRGKTSSFTVYEGTSATVSFTPDSGHRIASVKENSKDVTANVTNNRYTINSITANTKLEVTFEEIPPTTYSLSITATGNGSVTYNNVTLINKTQTFTVNEGEYATISISPESGYRIKSVMLNSTDVTANVKDNQYTTSKITSNTTMKVTFEAIPITTYTLTIKATGNGSASYDGTSVREKTSTFTVNEGTSISIAFSPDNGNSISSVKVDGNDVTSEVSGNRYVIENIASNKSVEVIFIEDVNALTVEGVNFKVTSQSDKTIIVVGGDFGQVLTVPAEVTQNGTTWEVTGIDNDALKNHIELAAIIWNPEVAFTATVNNPNLLLYVKAEEYNLSGIKNVIVNGTASNITLVDDASGNSFYCPQAFTAQKISYTHTYSMTTGVGETKGWETITLPFDVQTVKHISKGTIVPFAKWKQGDIEKPFWLYELTGDGFKPAESINAYTPYIISMPNNPQYDTQWLLNGEVTFTSNSVTIGETKDVKTASYMDRIFTPCFTDKAGNEGLYALNALNDYSRSNGGSPEGSRFILNLRNIHPFEAYMTTVSGARFAIDIFEDMTTTIETIESIPSKSGKTIYDLQGRKINTPSKKGVYIINGKKQIIK